MAGKNGLLAFAFIGLLVVSNAGIAGATTYYLVDYPLDQGGHHLSGTITTDGTIGDLGVSSFPTGYYNYAPQFGGHITAATYQIDNDPVYTVPVNNLPNAWAEVVATPTQIVLRPGNISQFQLIYNVVSVGVWGIGWQNSGSNVGPYSGSDQASGTVWNTASTSSAAGHLGANNSWVIAVVPEPATALLLGLGGVASLMMRRKARRK
jgi:PEP-CTERM motif-containing protein